VALAEAAGTAAAAFVATNVDDIVILSVLFARRGEDLRTSDIVGGQALGFALLVAASLAVAAGLLALPDEVVGVLGLVPIALGVRALLRRDGDGRPPPVAGLLGVASITVAGGADNVAVYAPLFATQGNASFVVTVVVFAAGLALWLALARLVGTRPVVIRLVDRAGHLAVPFVLIALGVLIVLESGLL
jgi:cadmium resistance protein CadD (predicted permease)